MQGSGTTIMRNLSVTLRGMALAIVLLWQPGAANSSEKVALVIGNASYEVGRLANPANDAADVAAALQGKGFDVTLALDQNREDLLRHLDAFHRKVRRGSIALVFYAGHAVEIDGQNWLLPVSNRRIGVEADVPIHSVSAQDVLRKVEARGARLNILILDACRDNPLPSVVRGSRGLAAVQGGQSSLVVYATAQGRTAQDGTGRNSPYTAALLKGLQDPSLSVRDLFDKVGAEVEQATGGAQVPWTSGKSIWPPVYLATPARKPVKTDDIEGGAPVKPEPITVEPIPASTGDVRIRIHPLTTTIVLAFRGADGQRKLLSREAGEGLVVFEHIPPGEVQIDLSAPGYLPRTLVEQVRAGDETYIKAALLKRY